MKEIIENLYPMNACLLGEGYDSRLEYMKHLLKLDVIEIPSNSKFGTWTVPEEWVVRDAWVKFNGEKIIDYSKQPLSLVVGSLPVHKTVGLDEFKKHLHYSEEFVSVTPYVFKYYDKDWGFCMPYNKVKEANFESTGILKEDGTEFIPRLKDKLEEGEYEVFVDSEYKPGTMKLGVHTIPGKSKREILLFAHLDHPFQANDNLSAGACLADLATKIKSDRTIKIVFCPETIGSIAYAHTQDLSKVDFVLAVDICGNDNSIMLNKSFNPEDRINRVAHLAFHGLLQDNRKGIFRSVIGSDETVFNDPILSVPGVMLSTWPYPEYHTSEDTPDKINYGSIEKMQKVVQKIIEIWDADFIPKREFVGPLMRSKYGIQSLDKKINLQWDYFIYSIDGKKTLAELCCEHGLVFELTLPVMLAMEKDGYISRTHASEGTKQKASKQKHAPNKRKANVPHKPGKVSKNIR